MKTRMFVAVMFAGVIGIPTARYVAAQSPVQVELKDASGASVGTAQVTAAKTGVSIALDLKNLPPGEHGDPYPSGGQVRGGARLHDRRRTLQS